MSSDKELRIGLQRVMRGEVCHFGFLKGAKDHPHSLTLSRKKLAGPAVQALQTESGNKIKPIIGRVRFDKEEKLVIFETRGAPGPLKLLLRDVVRLHKLPLRKFDVRRLESPGTDDDGEEPTIAGEGSTNGRGAQVVFTQARLAWDAARKHAHEQIARLKTAIREVYAEEPNFENVVASLGALDDVLARLDERFIDKLDEALNEAEEEGRQQRLTEARTCLGDYRKFLTDDPLVQALDANPFVPLTLQQRLLETIELLDAKLP
ncbi:MAG: hypothetical protein JNM56_39360 [Planctomycetia bacterium]|nr:hypothetical protein [Planctomycetia bacterium]